MGRKIESDDIVVKVTEKTCIKCETLKQASEFFKHRNNSCGLATYCKVCAREYNKKRYQEKGYHKKYHIDNKEKIVNKARQHYQDNTDSAKERMQKYYEDNKAEIDIVNRKWASNNKQACKAGRKVRLAVKNGELIRPDKCEIEECGRDVKIDFHHESYEEDNMMLVLGLCRSCHKRRHSGDPLVVHRVRSLFLKKFGFLPEQEF